MMTVREHDELWMGAFVRVPAMVSALKGLADSQRRANALEAIKELYHTGEMTKEVYVKSLRGLLESEGFSIV